MLRADGARDDRPAGLVHVDAPASAGGDLAVADCRVGPEPHDDAVAVDLLDVQGLEDPAGVQVAACIWLAMRREDLWPQAAAFWPERWLEGSEADRMSWIPFGGGVRRCAGAPFAEMEMREVLRAAADLTIRPARPESEQARRSLLVVVPERGGEILVG